MTTPHQKNQVESRGLPATTETPMPPTDGKYADRGWSDWTMLEEDDDGEWAKLEEDSKAEEGMPTPAVLECTVDRKSFSTRRVVKYLYSMPSAAPHNNILWLYRRGKDRDLQVEFFSKVHAIQLLQSHKHQAFVFNLKPSELHSSAQVPTVQNWISHGESIHIRLHIPKDQSRENVVNMFQIGRAQSQQQASTGPLQIQIPPRKRNAGEQALISEDIPLSRVQSRDNVVDGQQIVKVRIPGPELHAYVTREVSKPLLIRQSRRSW